jgi:hypothetical protein
LGRRRRWFLKLQTLRFQPSAAALADQVGTSAMRQSCAVGFGARLCWIRFRRTREGLHVSSCSEMSRLASVWRDTCASTVACVHADEKFRHPSLECRFGLRSDFLFERPISTAILPDDLDSLWRLINRRARSQHVLHDGRGSRPPFWVREPHPRPGAVVRRGEPAAKRDSRRCNSHCRSLLIETAGDQEPVSPASFGS